MTNKQRKSGFGVVDGQAFAVRVDGVPSDFFRQPFGRQLEARAKLKAFVGSAKSFHVGAKGKATLGAVRRWVKEAKPSQFYARWTADSGSWKDDSVQVFYV